MILLVGIVTISTKISARLPDNPAELQAWETSVLERIHELRQMPAEEAMPELAMLYRKYRLPTFSKAMETQVVPALETALAERPEFPGFFRDYVSRLKEEGLENGPAYNHYLTERQKVFTVLGYFHTPEVVDILAGFLGDNDKRRLPDLEGTLGQASASTLAGMLEDPPVPSSTRMDLWLEWRDQVREGKQTYSFKGSKKRYDFQGEVLATPRTSRRPVDERSERPAVDQANEPEETPWVPVAGALLALLLGFAFWKWKARPVS